MTLTIQNVAPVVRRFVKAIAEGLKPTEAAIEAGVTPDRAYDAARTLLRRPDVVGMIRDEQMNVIRAELVPLALNTARGLLQPDSAAPAAVRSSAAFKVLELGLRDGGTVGDALEQQFEGMTIDQVRARLDDVAAQIAARRAAKARPVVLDDDSNPGELFE